jgi:iron complex transport system substrate-binding protein
MSTQSTYPPFLWVHVKNIADGAVIQTTDFSKESLLHADPDFIFIDAGTPGVTDEIGGFEDITSPVFADMRAVKKGDVYATLPYNYRSSNLDTILADSYFVGKTVYPQRFADIDPKAKADEIYTMFVGVPVFDMINANCNNLGFERLDLSGARYRG